MFSGQSDKPKGAKQTPSVKAGAERRQRQMISVRQKAHGEVMKHVREDHTSGVAGLPTTEDGEPVNAWSFNIDTTPENVPRELLPEFVRMVMEGQSDAEVYQGVLMLRKILAVEKDPPHDEVNQSGVIPYLLNLMDRFEAPRLQFEAAWALTNVAAGTTASTIFIVKAGAIPRFVALLGSEHADCRDQGAWGLGNIAGEGVYCRDLLLQNGALPALLALLSDPEQPAGVLRNAVWALSNLTRGKPSPPLEQVSIALPTLSKLLHHEEKEIVIDAAWAISYISDGPAERVQAVIDSGVVPRVVEFLSCSVTPLQTSGIRTVGNIASGDDSQTQILINHGVLPLLGPLLMHPRREIRKETCWTISNIAAGNPFQIDALIASEIFPVVISNCLVSNELDVRKEAVWAIANITLCGVAPHLRYLLQCGVITPLCAVLTTHESRILTVALEALLGFLQLGEDDYKAGMFERNVVADAVLECGGVDSIERIQSYTDTNLYSMALSILETYFNLEDGAPNGAFDTSMDFGDATANQPNAGFDF
ncbi:putative importin alpha [Trypanosoma conorhini]|uniref:Importin subunit alpha n=1 Tax=Trypanosoma conorhini TaxID=83891 RepID=A0A422PI71_9TRYP|nr:putative importin alpha [Trypanosoma conorhini]RNF17425.1 putative importin alpha [Trypanosoma conorhini]